MCLFRKILWYGVPFDPGVFESIRLAVFRDGHRSFFPFDTGDSFGSDSKPQMSIGTKRKRFLQPQNLHYIIVLSREREPLKENDMILMDLLFLGHYTRRVKDLPSGSA